MKPKLILCLALVLSCGMFGCSTSSNHPKKENVELTYSPTGKVISVLIFRDGKLITAWQMGITEDGKWERTVNDGEGTILTFTKNGIVSGTETYAGGECIRATH